MAQSQVDIVGCLVHSTAQTINSNFTELYARPTGAATVLTADPTSPADDTWWIVRTGDSPAMQLQLRARINGVSVTIAGITL